MNKKLFIWTLVLVLLVSSVSALTLNSLSNGSTEGNLTYTGTTTFGKSFRIPRYTNITSAFITYKGKATALNFTTYQEWANQTTGCTSNVCYDTGTYEPVVTGGCQWLDYENLTDGNYATVAVANCSSPGIIYHYFNYTKPFGAIMANITMNPNGGSNVTRNVRSDCFANFDDKIAFRVLLSTSGSQALFCLQSSTWQLVYGDVSPQTKWAENGITWTYNQFPYNFRSGVANDAYRFNTTGWYNTTNISGDFKDALNKYLPACDCASCVINGVYCEPNIYFRSETYNGTIEYSNINISYNSSELNITFKDEISESIINDRNVSVRFISSAYSLNTTTDTGNVFQLLPNGNYTILYSATGYPTRLRTFENVGLYNPVLTYYLVNSTSAFDVTFNVIDDNFDNVQGADIVVQKFITTDNNFQTMLELSTDVNGKAIASLIPETELYRFLVYYNDILYWNNSAVGGEQVYDTGTDYVFQLNLDENIYELENILNDIASALTFDLDNYNDSAVGNYTYAYTSDTEQDFCLRVANITGTVYDWVDESCNTDSDSGTIVYNFNITKSTTFKAFGGFYYEGKHITTDSKANQIILTTENNPFKTETSYEGYLIAIILMIVAFLSFNTLPELAIISTELMFLVLVNTRIIYLTDTYRMTIMVTSLFLSIILVFITYQGGRGK